MTTSKGRVINAAKKVESYFTACEDFLCERSEEVSAIQLAMMTRQHVLLYGPSGTAKSLLARTVFSNIANSSFFRLQLNRYMSDDHLFGPIKIDKMKKLGVMEHNTSGTLADCNFAFLDEFLDANGATLRSMLEVLNERTFTRGRQRLNCPLQTAIATTNFYKNKDENEAVIDRFLMRCRVSPVSSNSSRLAMFDIFLSGDKDKKLPKLSATDLQEVQECVVATPSRIAMSKDLITTYLSLINGLRDAGIFLTDRRICWSLNLIKAAALANGRLEVSINDLQASKFGLIVLHDEAQEDIFAKAHTQHVVDSQERIKADREHTLIAERVGYYAKKLESYRNEQEYVLFERDFKALRRIEIGLSARRANSSIGAVDKRFSALLCHVQRILKSFTEKAVTL